MTTQGSVGPDSPMGEQITSRRRFLKQSALATAVVAVPYLAGKRVAFGNEGAKGADAALDRELEELVAMRGGPKGVIAIVQRGQHREVHAFGVRNLKGGLPLRANDRMRIASAAKAFSGAVALSLVSKGQLSLNDTIGERLPGLPDRWSKVTLRQLLNHTSGIPDFSLDEGYRKALFASLKKAPPPEKLLTYVYDEDLLFEPGSKYHYSNSDNIAVGLMVESATGRTYERQLREHVYGPLGLKKTTLPAGPNLRAPYIHGYDNDPSEQPPEDYSEIVAAGWSWASGGIVSTPSDLNDFIRGYVGGKLFDKQTRAKQRRVLEGGSSEPPGPGKNSAGLAVFRYGTKCGTVWGHTGNTPGYTQFMAASPDGSRSVVVSVNEQLNPKDGAPGVFKALRKAEGLAVCAALTR
ncbi:MAG: Beta-lactamase class C-like and penicillin binding proteins (PBPs) superfamily [uncultured Rubrobacteraceae bacterium]|uniref:Beta-lactamase class C-like and penicillin binding proteins (PBPs) superfamily n=1 Tax=uncultured Rubrobacteraceae bacterium TaxID=349277 RepID=A0A6J4QH99_9ACTN|nr:MAG: Beta-lactamase class C-like and penicillin binding proteins (PBPs) superfamily [uncultured Rubrobacteraceae bacterium]